MPQSHDSVYPWTSSSTIFARPVVEDNTLKPYSLGWLLKYGSTKAIVPTRKQITKQNKNLYMLSCKNISHQRLGCHMCENQAQDKWDNLQLLLLRHLIQFKDIPFSFLISVCLCELSKTTRKNSLTSSLKFCEFSTNWTLHIGQKVRSQVWHPQNSIVPSNVAVTGLPYSTVWAMELPEVFLLLLTAHRVVRIHFFHLLQQLDFCQSGKGT